MQYSGVHRGPMPCDLVRFDAMPRWLFKGKSHERRVEQRYSKEAGRCIVSFMPREHHSELMSHRYPGRYCEILDVGTDIDGYTRTSCIRPTTTTTSMISLFFKLVPLTSQPCPSFCSFRINITLCSPTCTTTIVIPTTNHHRLSRHLSQG